MMPRKELMRQGGDPEVPLPPETCLSFLPQHSDPGLSYWHLSRAKLWPKGSFSDLYNFQRISINLLHLQDEWQLEAKCFPAREREVSLFPASLSPTLPFAGELNVLTLEGPREARKDSNAILPP
uniref:Uncharacterized protein n=1 Tax=Myotis myotis TaxID=51298 RepID=A0A7J7XIG2_MYOMY|nr:hypothetical protein mMyoMyo1_011652 [Myotis myotis]